MRLIIELSQNPQGRLESSVAHPDDPTTVGFDGIIELVGVLEQHLRAEPPDNGPPRGASTPG